MKRIIVVSAHPDDMEIGMGGTVAKLAEQDAHVVSIILTDGGGSANPFSLPRDQIVQMRRNEAQNAALQLGVKETIFLEATDLNETTQYESTRQKLAQWIESSTPEEIYTLHPEIDRHPTHRLTGKMTLEALPDSARQLPVWAYEVWGLFHTWDRLEDISNEIGKKLGAINAHSSQIAVFPFGEAASGLNRWRAVFADPQEKRVQALFAEVFLRLC